ncbi:threonine/homoserine/homoserine lactone efflux protein [Pseudomonas duriflava]|uniref:Threonine/homoserine/homoserine lactone efflux protein n=1 Tax=Pseudomonas duriflava TaxID=459528 RepID=A0A562QHY9_9PSED|nr:LysE family translocator [Pseudomonas duriflava]TWI55666.1 threonine/homoserine/homoserine lactone efflux protein [Pseudomonas duriflava]
MDMLFPMAAFALASSISPGPVNLVALGAGARHGFLSSLQHVTGATVGFTVLLLSIGLGLYKLLGHVSGLIQLIQWGGVVFLLYMAYQLARDDGSLGANSVENRPSLYRGALMQWLNPKAWLASLAGMGAYAADGDVIKVWQFAALYFVVCYGSIACWAYAGSFLKSYVQQPRRIRLLNRIMAALLAGSAFYLLKGGALQP